MSEKHGESEYQRTREQLLLRLDRLNKKMATIKESEDLLASEAPLRTFVALLRVIVDVLVYRVGAMFNDVGRKRIHRPPASAMNSFFRIMYSKRTYERIFMQIVLDLREEHAEALQANRPKFARWITLRGNAIMLATMVTHAFMSCGKAAVKIWKLTL